MKKWLTYTILGIILIVGLCLRGYNLNVWPREGATFDEYAWTFLGLSLWEKGVPTSWSPHSEYKNKVNYINSHGAHFILVSPYLEHPPLFGLVAGGFAWLNGVRSFDDVTIARIRPLALILGVLAIAAVYLLASEVYGDIIGLVAAGLYSIVPTVVIGSRIVQNENFFIPFFLLALYLTHLYIRKSKVSLLYGIALINGLLPLAKVPWMAAPLAVIAIFLYAKKWREALTVAVVTAVCFSGFLAWGFMLDTKLFISLWKLQLARYDLTFDSLFILFRDPIIVDRALVDGWIYFGWAAIVWLLTRDLKKHLPIVMGFLSYGAMFVFAIPSEPQHGWYRYPFYPFLIIAVAVFLIEHLNKNFFTSAIFFVVTGLSMLAESWGKTLGFSYPVFRTYLGSVAVGALPGIFPKLSSKIFFKYVNYALICIIVLLSIWVVIQYNEQ
jgi:4-amino-4-deoxy-L-arabinose transferase-like glycosyltransferase